MIRVLIVDDEPQLLRALVLNLTRRGYDVTTATTGTGALAQTAASLPDMIVLDLGLPDMDGIEVIRELRRRGVDVPITVLSARSGSAEKVEALDAGAADFVVKPFDISELTARLRAVGRRSHLTESDGPIQIGAASVDVRSRIVTTGGEASDGATVVHLTPNEWRILEILLRRPGSLITNRELLTTLRGESAGVDRSYLRIYMQQLRRKLEPDPARPRFLITEPGMGYRFQP